MLPAKYVLLATGSRAFHPKAIPFDDPRVFDSDSINGEAIVTYFTRLYICMCFLLLIIHLTSGLDFLPKSIAITGSGIIAVEYAKSNNSVLGASHLT